METSVGLTFSFANLSSPLNVSISFAPPLTTYALTYGNNTLDIDYNTQTKLASASWEASQDKGLTLNELLSFANFPELDNVAASLDIALKSFSLAYDGEQDLCFVDLVLESGSTAFFVAVKTTNPSTHKSTWNYAFGFYLHDTLSFAQVPLIGKQLGNKFSISDLHLAYVSPQLDSAAITLIDNALVNNSLSRLATDQNGLVTRGIMAGADFDFSDLVPTQTMTLGGAPPESGPQSSPQSAPQSGGQGDGQGDGDSTDSNGDSTSSSGLQKTIKINKSLGPVHIQSLGVGYSNGELEVDISGGIATGPLSFSLQGLGIANPLTKIDPSFSLDGLGINLSAPPITIGGDLLKVDPPPDNVTFEYNGEISLGLTQVQVDAWGSYAQMTNGDASLFVNAVLDYPLGGPPFCFVTGLAAAFGYNRDLIAPAVADIATYPLVAAANSNDRATNPDPAAQAAQVLSQLNDYLPPEAGEYFAGIGLKFTSFGIIDCFAMLMAKFGKELEFDLLATATYTAPAPEDPEPVAVVELGVLGQIIPSEGEIMVQGQLTPASFLYDKHCHLTGGFAVGLWTDGQYEGDFVYTFGGYGSHYKPPAHYPQNVPGIGMQWQIDSDMSVKGSVYWAITPQIVAAGGSMSATYHASFFKAWFDLDAYFQINWKPFHYEAGFHVDFGLKVKIDLLFTTIWKGFSMSAGLDVQGPPFGGKAKISLCVCTIHLHFGSSSDTKPPLTWSEFSSAFLPQAEQMLNINLTSGLVKTTKDESGNEVWIINPKDLCITTNAAFPATSYSLKYQEQGQSSSSDLQSDQPTAGVFGIKPMGVGTGGFTATHNITVTGPDSTCQLKAVAKPKNSPKAIWENVSDSKASSSTLVSTLNGFQLIPGQEPAAGITHSVARNTLAWELEVYDDAFVSETLWAFSGSQATTVNQLIQTSDAARSSVLTALGMQKNIPSADTLASALNNTFTPNLIIGSFNQSS